MLNTLLVVIEQSLLHMPLICGAYLSFSLLKVPDLSIESAYVIGAILGSHALANTTHLPLIMGLILILGASIIGGALVGLTSSLLTQKGKFSHLLSSVVTAGLFHGINQFISPSYVSLNTMHNPLTLCSCMATYPEVPILALIGIVITVLIFLLFKTQLGYSYAVYGDNPHFFSNYGISTSFVFISGIMIANALAGLSGYLFAQSNNFVELNMGLGKALLCITALILGKGIIHIKKPFSILIPIAGTLAYFALQQMLLKAGFNLKYFTAVQALLVLCILLYTYRKHPQQSPDNLGV